MADANLTKSSDCNIGNDYEVVQQSKSPFKTKN